MHLRHMRPHQLRQAVADGWPLLVPAGCVETHGPHMAIGHDTIMEAPLALAFKRAAAELTFEAVLEQGHPRGWWADPALRDVADWGRVEVQPMILPAASPPAGGDHAGYNETSFLLATRPELVAQARLDIDPAPWYCRQLEERNSWTANADHGRAMVDAVVDAWVARLQGR